MPIFLQHNSRFRMISQLELLKQLENQVEAHVQIAIKSYQNLSSEQLLQASPTGGWSIAQCLEHLNSYGVHYLPLLQAQLAQALPLRHDVPHKSSWLGRLAVNSMNPDTGKKKYKAFKNHTPQAELDAHQVVATFIDQQELLLSLVRQARHKAITPLRIPISIAPWLKLNWLDALHFLVIHNERHVQQANRI